MIETPQNRAQSFHQKGMSFLNQAQNDQIDSAYKKELLQAAVQNFSTSVLYDPQWSEGWIFLGHSLQQAHKTSQARKAYEVGDRLKGYKHTRYMPETPPQTFAFIFSPAQSVK